MLDPEHFNQKLHDIHQLLNGGFPKSLFTVSSSPEQVLDVILDALLEITNEIHRIKYPVS